MDHVTLFCAALALFVAVLASLSKPFALGPSAWARAAGLFLPLAGVAGVTFQRTACQSRCLVLPHLQVEHGITELVHGGIDIVQVRFMEIAATPSLHTKPVAALTRIPHYSP